MDPGHTAIQDVCKDYSVHAVSQELRDVLQERGHCIAADNGEALTATRRCNQCGLCRKSFVRAITQLQDLHLNIPVCSVCYNKLQASASTETCAFCRLEGPATRSKQPDKEKLPKNVEWLRCREKSCKPKFCADCIKFLAGPSGYENAKQNKWPCFACSNESHFAIARARKEESNGLQVLSLFDGIAGAAVALRR
jgi:hypothetical protein